MQRLWLVLTIVGGGACAPTIAPASPSRAAAASLATAALATASHGSVSSEVLELVPHRDAVVGELVVRPDTLAVEFVVRGDTVDAMQREVEAFTDRLKEVAGKGLLRMRGFAPYHGAASSKMSGSPGVVEWTIDGSLEIELLPAADYWTRARLTTAMQQVVTELQKQNQARDVGPRVWFSSPRLLLRNAEQYRQQLLERWIARAHQLATVSRGGGSPMHLRHCQVPGPISQRVISMEEIALSLPISCELELDATK